MMKNICILLISFSFSMLSAASVDSLIVKEYQDKFTVQNQNTTIQFRKDTWKVSLIDMKDQVQFSDVQAPQFLIEDKWESLLEIQQFNQISASELTLTVSMSNGQKATGWLKKAGNSGFKISIEPENATALKGWNLLNPVEEVYGFGETWNGEVAQRGEVIEIWDRVGTPDECSYMPYYVSTQNYAFFLDYGGRVKFDIGQKHSEQLVFEAPTGKLEYLLVSGESIASAVGNFLKETGLPAKPPRWAFKPWFWLMGDPDIPGAHISTLKDHHFIEMIHKLDSLNIPVGTTWFEPPWQTARTTFIPNPEFSKDIKSLINEIENSGVRVLAWTVPYTTVGAANFKEAVEKGFLVKNPDNSIDAEEARVSSHGELLGDFYNYIDFYNPEAQNWWKKQITGALDLGLKGFKLDAAQDLQEDALVFGGRIGKDFHNSYALEYNKVFYQALKEKYGDDFLMIPRATWVGSASYTNFKWPGDLSGTFGNNGLPSSLYSSLSLALSGFPFVSSDIGGFEPSRQTPEDVWIRWAQFGAMLPGMQTMQMPWWFSEKAQEHFRFLSWLHTDLTPYWMSLANEAHILGTPICRPLVWEYQDDINTWSVDDQFIVGQYLMVAPIINTEPERDVYLPEGNWIDFWDENLIVTGGGKFRWKNENRAEGLWKFPLYIKEGAIIPMEIVNEISGFGSEYSANYITIAIWPDHSATTEFTLHDQENPVRFLVSGNNQKKLEIAWTESSKDYLFRVRLKEKKPTIISQGRKKPLRNFKETQAFKKSSEDGWCFDDEKSTLWIRQSAGENKSQLTIDFN